MRVTICLEQKRFSANHHQRGAGAVASLTPIPSGSSVLPLPLLRDCYKGHKGGSANSHGQKNAIQGGATTGGSFRRACDRVYNKARKVRFGTLVNDGWFSATPDDTGIPRAIRTNNPGEALAAPDRWTYRDFAITPPEKDEFERLSLYHETTAGVAALARKRRDDVIRAGGHVYEAPPLAEDMTMATPAE
jgi:hypothetical protein